MFQIDFGSVDHLEQPFITSPWCEGVHSVRISIFLSHGISLYSDLFTANIFMSLDRFY